MQKKTGFDIGKREAKTEKKKYNALNEFKLFEDITLFVFLNNFKKN